MYFSANWVILGSSDVRIWPKVLLLNATFGLPGRKLLVTLYASARNSRLWFSRNANTRERAISNCQVPGAAILRRPRFPRLPSAGNTNAVGSRYWLKGPFDLSL